jgi:hypothetical protein
MTLLLRIGLALLAAAALAGCAYQPLKAPCSPDEGGAPLSYTETAQPQTPSAFQSLDACGPMRPL